MAVFRVTHSSTYIFIKETRDKTGSEALKNLFSGRIKETDGFPRKFICIFRRENSKIRFTKTEKHSIIDLPSYGILTMENAK